jgi:hypothetical protein
MPRRLTVARVGVAPEREQEYLVTLRRLAGLARARGEHLWLFRHPGEAGTFLEFGESGTGELRQGDSAIDSEESALERRLHTIASYAPGARVPWEEVQLEDG